VVKTSLDNRACKEKCFTKVEYVSKFCKFEIIPIN